MSDNLIIGRPLVRHLEPEPQVRSKFLQRRPNVNNARARLGVSEEHIFEVAGLGAMVASNDDSHLMTIAPTGAGKGRDVIIPNLLSYEGSVIVLDPKGENYDVTHRHRREKLGQEIVLLDPFGATRSSGRGDHGSLNPFSVFEELKLNRQESELEEASDFGRLLSEILTGGLKSLADPFWDEMAQLLVASLTSELMTGQPGRPNTLRELRSQLFDGDLQYKMATALDTRGADMPPGTAQEFKMLLSIDQDKTFPGILATAAQQFAPFSSKRTVAATDSTSFSLSSLIDPDQRISVYIVIPPHKLRTHQRLLRVWVGCLLYFVMNRQNNRSSLLFVIDEAAQLGKFSLLIDAITLLRGYGLRTWTFWQDLAQLHGIYGIEGETMINNSGVLQVFGPSNFGAARAISERIGCAEGELLQLLKNEQIVAFKNEWPTKLNRTNYLTDPVLSTWAYPNPRHDPAQAA
jgi:type IV secretion system protein VirD4